MFISLDKVSIFGEEGQRETHAWHEYLEWTAFEVPSSYEALGCYSSREGLWQELNQQ